jgi:SsrA-binding protein
MAGQSLERAIDEMDIHAVRKVFHVAGGETLFETVEVDLYGRLGDLLVASFERRAAAPRQKLCVIFHRIDQAKHLVRRMSDEYGLIYLLHTLILTQGLRGTDAKMRLHSAISDLMSIAQNKKAFHDYFIEERFEAGLVLEGWEVKAIRAGRAQLKEAYVVVLGGALNLIGAHISPLPTASTHVHPDPTRTRKLLMHRDEIDKLIGKVERAGYTLVPLDLHYTRGRIKLDIGLAKGKKQHDKREAEKDREWQREKQRLLKVR